MSINIINFTFISTYTNYARVLSKLSIGPVKT